MRRDALESANIENEFPAAKVQTAIVDLGFGNTNKKKKQKISAYNRLDWTVIAASAGCVQCTDAPHSTDTKPRLSHRLTGFGESPNC